MNAGRITALAFEGRLRDALRALDRLDRSTLDPSEIAEAAWLSAYVDAAMGEFAAAEAAAARLIHDGPTGIVRARAAVTLGSVLRQTDRHAQARVVEDSALASAPGAEVRRHLLIGLAADAVGLGELDVVVATLRRVGSELVGGWRAATRLRWVRCERDLLAGRPRIAARHARDALALARSAGARRHEAKSLLFLGASLREAEQGRPDTEADSALAEALRIASRIGARPIADVAGAMLGRPSTPPR